MITYKTILGQGRTLVISVRLDGKRVGEINGNQYDGYYYRTNTTRGETFPTVEAVKRDIEGV